MGGKQKSVSGLSRRKILKYGLYSGLAAGLAPSLWLSGCGKRWGRKRPNVLLIVLDTARADRFSCLGCWRQTSPHIDALALEGVVYERAYTTNFWTLPSHASLFTGLYPSQAGTTPETLRLPVSNTTLAEVVKEAGYDVAAFVCNPWVSTERGFGQGFDEFYEMWRGAMQSQVIEQFGRAEWAALKKVLEWLDRWLVAPQGPFFVFVNFNCAHLPYQPPEPFLSRFIGTSYNNEEINRVAAITSGKPHLAGQLKLSERDFHIMSDLYDGEIAFSDYCVGQIVQRLRTFGVLDETVVVVTSDHGENLGEHGHIEHFLSMYETILHIPLVIRYPERLPAGARISDLVSLIDIAPTILDLCGIQDVPKTLNPREMSLACDGRPRRAFVMAENERPVFGIALMKNLFPDFDITAIDYPMQAVRTDRYKLIWNIGRSMELFDLQTDPGELYNLADTRIETRNKLHGILTRWMEQVPSAGSISSSSLESQDEESLKILRSLGYVE